MQDLETPGAVSFPTSSETSVGAPYLSAAGGKVHFEVDCVEGTGKINVGLAGTNFRGQVVSACEASWSIYSDGKAYHRSVPPLGGSARAALTLSAAGIKK